jgi:CDP-diacylglycerol---glycerol-3-phosphate 3-phosphatidyltransferase
VTTVVNLPNTLTLTRIILIPVFIVIYYLPWSWSHGAAAVVFFVASFTDWLDGYLARKLGQLSPFGAFLDPVADKLLVASSLLILVGEHTIHWITLPAVVIVGREIVISGLREWMAEIGRRASVAVNFVGKIKTAAQMTSLLLLIAYRPGFEYLQILGVLLLYVASILTIWSMVIYFLIAWRELSKKVDMKC